MRAWSVVGKQSLSGRRSFANAPLFGLNQQTSARSSQSCVRARLGLGSNQVRVFRSPLRGGDAIAQLLG